MKVTRAWLPPAACQASALSKDDSGQAKRCSSCRGRAQRHKVQTWGHEGCSETLGARGRILSGREDPWKGLSQTEPPPRNRGTPLSDQDWQPSNHTVKSPTPLVTAVMWLGTVWDKLGTHDGRGAILQKSGHTQRPKQQS